MVSAASVAGGHWGHLWVLVVGASLCVHGHVSFVLFALEGQVNRVTGWFSTTTAPTPWSRNDAVIDTGSLQLKPLHWQNVDVNQAIVDDTRVPRRPQAAQEEGMSPLRAILKANVDRFRRAISRERQVDANSSAVTTRPAVAADPSAEDVVELGHRLILGRPPEPDLRKSLVSEIGSGRMTTSEALASMVSSDEFLARITHQRAIIDAIEPPFREGMINVEDLRAAKSVAEHNESAEAYFASRDVATTEVMIAKPYSDAIETTELLTCFGHMVAGLELARGETLLDFGAGTGWTSWNFAQLGCEVIISDVSAAALDLAAKRFGRWPLSPGRSKPNYLVFDGSHLDLPDDSVDKACCFDAFHHLVNQSVVMAEFARVLKPGGLLGFAEPGLHHSKADQSQLEMRQFGVVEGDIDLLEMAAMAEGVGLKFVAADVLTVRPIWADLEDFTDLVDHRVPTAQMVQEFANQIHAKQLFILRKPGGAGPDSRNRQGLGANLNLESSEISRAGDHFEVRLKLTVHNTGRATWLPDTAPVGGVRLGGIVPGPERWEGRLSVASPLTLVPDQRILVEAHVRVPARFGGQELHVNLVSEGVAWFDICGTPAVQLQLPA